MLCSLHIKNYVLIDSLEVDFPEGLVIVSGPTGAGKSLLIGALGLLTGAKADAAAISEGAESLVVEGEFKADSSALEELCRENDIEYDGGFFTLRRMVARSGRSRAFVNDCPVQLSVLGAFGAQLVDIHSQHDTLLLQNKAFQLDVLDKYASHPRLLSDCATLYDKAKSIQKQVDTLRDQLTRNKLEGDFNRSVFEQLDKAGLRAGELEELEAEQYQLANAEQIKELLGEALGSFDGDGQVPGVNTALSTACRALEKLSSFVPEVRSLAERVDQARIELKDVSADLETLNERLDSSPDRLQWVDDRISSLYALMKRYQCEDETALIAKRDSLAMLVGSDEDLEYEIRRLETELQSARKELENAADKLHVSRVQAAGRFCKEIEVSLAKMELEGSSFQVSFDARETGPAGKDEITFLFASSGQKASPVAKCASGGELSRIMLSLKSVMSRFMNMPVMIFDEIDTGVSGSVADKMGRAICEMSSRMQVFAITHLPQVAAKGSAHFLVGKANIDGKVRSSVARLDMDGRINEIARMLSGSDITAEALANAKALIGQQ